MIQPACNAFQVEVESGRTAISATAQIVFHTMAAERVVRDDRTGLQQGLDIVLPFRVRAEYILLGDQ